MARIEKTDALTLRVIPFRETSLLIHLFTRDFGKITVLAKGIRQKKPYILSHFEPFVYTSISFYNNPRREIHILGETCLKETFQSIRNDFDTVCAASYMVELVDKVSLAHSPHEEIFDVFVFCLCELKEMPIKKVLRYFEVKVLSGLGLFPHLEKCVLCGNDNRAEGVSFSFQQGGMICSAQRCLVHSPDCVALSQEASNAIRFIQRSSLDEFNRFFLSRRTEIEIQRLLQVFIEYHLNVQLRTVQFFHEVKAARLL
jgi:DNA repair protein RecO (recombination protein O)